MSRNEEDVKKIWDGMDENQRTGVRFGMFPANLGLGKDDCVLLMKFAEQDGGMRA